LCMMMKYPTRCDISSLKQQVVTMRQQLIEVSALYDESSRQLVETKLRCSELEKRYVNPYIDRSEDWLVYFLGIVKPGVTPDDTIVEIQCGYRNEKSSSTAKTLFKSYFLVLSGLPDGHEVRSILKNVLSLQMKQHNAVCVPKCSCKYRFKLRDFVEPDVYESFKIRNINGHNTLISVDNTGTDCEYIDDNDCIPIKNTMLLEPNNAIVNTLIESLDFVRKSLKWIDSTLYRKVYNCKDTDIDDPDNVYTIV